MAVEDTRATQKEYDDGAAAYQDTSYKKDDQVEFHTFFQHTGHLSGKKVLDVACGEGRYTRLIKQRGAADVVGLDLSEEMVKLAQQQVTEKCDISYFQHDLASPLPAHLQGQFDVVCSQYLLCYATTEDVLETMVRHCFGAVKPGCTFVSLTDNPTNTPDQYRKWEDYGYVKKTDGEVGVDGMLPEGTSVKWVFANGFESEVWIHHPKTYEAAFLKAGFVDVEWFGFTVPPQFVFDKSSVEYLAPRILEPPVLGIKARRPE
uniref:Methyltransferase domain-containing protein n=1 Tax=Noctiluca scintillans TaxID=2966 RepID=A0A7S0ZZT4_NOCSC|mmetsp:Transcript_25708/g.67269  ORF Transcript_25708/g.67269 Transcript_25708/m.67269 type:complete len:261 (+) Transcript_25708:43-825(+)|eukprot:CAMPEP_0194545624 /NCGR_PEP_ID=MMETSP0253-20130528/89489_1 /TAXON_ID=2966 /ORGANISM="Noctiluca scintillans" /LENGTH=260 /DNA_ID=CAMNT_0039392635 /DNA_START=24 /DNA_END=806 /DNA_ORIENTATION=-